MWMEKMLSFILVKPEENLRVAENIVLSISTEANSVENFRIVETLFLFESPMFRKSSRAFSECTAGSPAQIAMFVSVETANMAEVKFAVKPLTFFEMAGESEQSFSLNFCHIIVGCGIHSPLL